MTQAEIEKLIVCDIIEATVKRINVDKKFYKLGKEDERKVNMLTGPLW